MSVICSSARRAFGAARSQLKLTPRSKVFLKLLSKVIRVVFHLLRNPVVHDPVHKSTTLLLYPSISGGCLTVHLRREIKWNANFMQLGNFIEVFLARHISGTYANHQEH